MKKNKTTSSLIQFSVANFGCFRDRVDFSMTTRRGAKNSFQLLKTDDHLLKSSVIYGPNASGKSTLLNALNFVDFKVYLSTDQTRVENFDFNPFLLEAGFDEKPSFFEIVFAFKDKIYRYDFAVDRNHEIVTENLFDVTHDAEKTLFTRTGLDIEVDKSFSTDDEIKKRTKKKALYLSTLSQWDNQVSEEITEFFSKSLNILDADDLFKHRGFTAEKSQKDSSFKALVLEYLQKADFCITNFEVEKTPIPKEMKDFFLKIEKEDIPDEMKTISFLHNKYNQSGEIIGSSRIPMKFQSDGTNSFFGAIGPIIDTLESGKILVIDELNKHLHPLLCKFIVDLFNSKKTNPHNAQLIFTTHDVTLLSNDSIDRDQFWFTERDRYGAAKLFALSEFKDRKDAKFQARYMAGRYGALPFIDFKN